MLKFKRMVVAGEFLNPEEAFEANRLIKLIKATLDCGVSRHLPLFKVLSPHETMARIVCTVRYPRNEETLIVTLEYREAGSEEWKKVETELHFFENDWNNLKNAFHASFDYEYDYDSYWGIGE